MKRVISIGLAVICSAHLLLFSLAAEPNSPAVVPPASNDPSTGLPQPQLQPPVQATAPAQPPAAAVSAFPTQPGSEPQPAAGTTAPPPTAPGSAPSPAAAAIAPVIDPNGGKKEEAKGDDEEIVDFEHEEAFMDVPDALRSKQFVHRAILSTIIRDTAKVTLGAPYFSNLLGFNAIYSPSGRGALSFAKYVSGLLGFAVGFANKSGHSGEIGLELSGVSSLFLGYRYIFHPAKFTFWPTVGAGVGTEIPFHLADPPIEAQVYQGMKQMGFCSLGALVPLVDLAFRIEARFNFYGLDRLILTTGAGVIFFL